MGFVPGMVVSSQTYVPGRPVLSLSKTCTQAMVTMVTGAMVTGALAISSSRSL